MSLWLGEMADFHLVHSEDGLPQSRHGALLDELHTRDPQGTHEKANSD